MAGGIDRRSRGLPSADSPGLARIASTAARGLVLRSRDAIQRTRAHGVFYSGEDRCLGDVRASGPGILFVPFLIGRVGMADFLSHWKQVFSSVVPADSKSLALAKRQGGCIVSRKVRFSVANPAAKKSES